MLILVWGITSGDMIAAQDIRPLPVEDALNVHDITFFAFLPIGLSPDAKWLAYTVQDNQHTRSVGAESYARTGVPTPAVGAGIWLTNVETGERTSLTGGKGDNWCPVWSPDGHYVAFFSNRDGGGQARLWVWDATKKDLRKVSELNIRGIDQIEWTPDSRSLLVTTLPEGLSPDDYAHRMSTPENKRPSPAEEAPSGVALYESHPSSKDEKESPQSDPWNLDWRTDLVLIDVTSGKATTVVHNRRIQKYLLSPDGSRVAYTSAVKFEKAGSQQILFDLVVTSVPTKQERIVAPGIQLELGGREFRWSPDGSRIVYHVGGQGAANYDCYVVSPNGGAAQNISLLPEPTHQEGSGVPLWDATGEHVYFVQDGALWKASLDGTKAIELSRIPSRYIGLIISRSDGVLWTDDAGKSTVVVAHDDEGVQDGFYKIDLTRGESARLFERGQCYQCAPAGIPPVVRGSGAAQRIAYFAEDSQHDNEIWLSDVDFQNPQQITHLNPQFERYKLGSARLIDWLSDDGERLKGVLLLPSDYRDGERYPMVVVVYGGGNLSHGFDRFGSWASGAFNMQLLATRGYAVLLPDSPQHPGTPMLDLAKTVLPGINKVIEMGIADPDRLGVMGQSNGGYSTLALIVQTKRFKAAIEIAGMGDLVSDYGFMGKDGTAYSVGLFEHGQDLMGGTPWEFRGRYLENSPIGYLDRVETPLLIVHGTADATVPPTQGDEVFVGLRRLGKEAEYAKYEGEGHSPLYWSYDHQVDFDNRMITWFDEYLKKTDERSNAGTIGTGDQKPH
jgi:dipeptidyl aminopeptidase/acylaminoacyl peptidase